MGVYRCRQGAIADSTEALQQQDPFDVSCIQPLMTRGCARIMLKDDKVSCVCTRLEALPEITSRRVVSGIMGFSCLPVDEKHVEVSTVESADRERSPTAPLHWRLIHNMLMRSCCAAKPSEAKATSTCVVSVDAVCFSAQLHPLSSHN